MQQNEVRQYLEHLRSFAKKEDQPTIDAMLQLMTEMQRTLNATWQKAYERVTERIQLFNEQVEPYEVQAVVYLLSFEDGEMILGKLESTHPSSDYSTSLFRFAHSKGEITYNRKEIVPTLAQIEAELDELFASDTIQMRCEQIQALFTEKTE